jgi:hypothetical protein
LRFVLPSRRHATRPRRVRRLLTGAACAGFAIVMTACNLVPPSQPPKVILYGDSLSVEAWEPFANRIQQNGIAEAVNRTANGTAICDWFDEMEQDLVNIRPTAVVIEFAGNPDPACVAGSGKAPIDAYRDDAQRVIDIFNTQGVHVYLTSTPKEVVGSGTPELPDPWRDMYFVKAVENSVRFADAGHALFDFTTGQYEMKSGCAPSEGATEGCINGEIQVRDPSDGLHFCPSGARPIPCAGYVGGAVRYGFAMAGPVASQLGF